MSDERFDALLDRVREAYHAPPKTPREEMWRVVSQRMREPVAQDEATPVIDLTAAKRRRGIVKRRMGWASVAAAALVVLGIGIGRSTAPGVATGPVATTQPAERGPAIGEAALRLVANEHLGRSESLLTMVRADARDGSLSPGTGRWARDLLLETRLLMDARSGEDREIRALLEDLELVLAQIVGVTEGGTTDGSRARTELDLAVRGLENGEMLSRIQAAIPAGQSGA
jgi:hypothetical protein